MTTITQRRNKHSLEYKSKLSRNSSTANKALWFLSRPPRKCGTFSAMTTTPIPQSRYRRLNHFVSCMTRPPRQHNTVHACHTWLILEGDTETTLMLSGMQWRLRDETVLFCRRWMGERKLPLTFGRSQNRFYLLGWGIRNGQLSGGGDETGDSQGHTEGLYWKGKQNKAF